MKNFLLLFLILTFPAFSSQMYITGGGGSGVNCASGTNGQVYTTNGSTCSFTTVSGTGTVVGPVSSTNLAIATYSGTGGQTLLNNSGATISAGVLTIANILDNGLTASTALASDGSKNLVSSSTTATELGYVHGVTSALQTQLGLLAPLASPTFTGTIGTPLTASKVVQTDGSGNLTTGTTSVAQGGTGDTSLTAYAVLAGGTTSTGAVQSVSGLGSSGNVLTSNGAGALPTWQAAGGGSSPLTTKGDLFGFSTVSARVAVGATDGVPLVVDSSNANGVSYSSNFVRVPSHTTTFLFDDGSIGEVSLKGSANQSIISNQADGIHFTTNAVFDALLYSDGTWQTNKQMVAGATTLARPAYNFGFSASGLHFQGTNQVSLVTNSLIAVAVDANQNTTLNAAQALGYQRVASATSAGSTTINNNISVLVLHAAGTLTTYTVTMPATPIDGQAMYITSNAAITSLTLSPNTSQSIVGAPSTLALGGGINYIWVNTDSTWYPI